MDFTLFMKLMTQANRPRLQAQTASFSSPSRSFFHHTKDDTWILHGSFHVPSIFDHTNDRKTNRDRRSSPAVFEINNPD